MTINEVIAYVMHNPENTNPAILRDLLTELVQGGSSTNDFEYAKITVTNTSTEPEHIVDANCYMIENDFFSDTLIPVHPEQTELINGVMYKKTLYLYITAAEKPTITGNITLDDEDEDEYTYIVSGDCSISAKGRLQNYHDFE